MGINQESIEIFDNENGEGITLTVTSLVSNVRDMLLMKIRNDKAKQVWSKMNEQEQAREIELAQDFSRTLVQTVASIVATRNSATIRALLDNFKVKDGAVVVTAKGIADDQALVALNHVGKKALMITVVDVDQFDEVRKPAEPDPDQGTMFGHDETEDDDGPSLADAMHDAIDNDEQPADEPEPDDTADDLQPYEQGAGAAEHGLDISANPFKGGSDDYSHWRRGFNDWHDANPQEESEVIEGAEPIEDATGDAMIPTEADDESGMAELFEAVDTEEDGPVIEHEETEQLDLVTIKKDGGQARVDGLGMDECPFDGGTDAYEAWAKGWRATDDQIDGLMEEGSTARRNGDSSKKCPWKAGSKENGYWMIGYNRAKSEEKD